jgi:hypothetical protein
MNRKKASHQLLLFPVLTSIMLATFTLPAKAVTVNLSRGYVGKVCVDIGNSSSPRNVRVTWGNWSYQGQISGSLTQNALIEMNSRGYVDSFNISAYYRHRQAPCPNTFFWNDWNVPPGSPVFKW